MSFLISRALAVASALLNAIALPAAMDSPNRHVYIPDMPSPLRIDTQPRLPAIEILTASWEDLRFWNWDQDGLPYWRLYWNDARGASILRERRVDLDSQHLYLIAPHTPTKLRLVGRLHHFFVHFVVSPPFHHPQHGVWTFPLNKREQSSIRELISLLIESDPPAGAVLRLLAVVSRTLAGLPPDAWCGEPMDRRIHQATMLIEQGIGQTLTVESLAEQVGMSTAAFARLFRSRMGQSPYRYILRRRTEIAAVRLGTTDAPIEQIAASCGFCDRYHFTRIFSRQYSVGPSEFRRHRFAAR